MLPNMGGGWGAGRGGSRLCLGTDVGWSVAGKDSEWRGEAPTLMNTYGQGGT